MPQIIQCRCTEIVQRCGVNCESAVPYLVLETKLQAGAVLHPKAFARNHPEEQDCPGSTGKGTARLPCTEKRLTGDMLVMCFFT